MDQFTQRLDQTRLLDHRCLASASGAANPIVRRRLLLCRQLLEATSDGTARDPGYGGNGSDASTFGRQRFTGGKKPQALLIKIRAHGLITDTDAGGVDHQPYNA